VGVVETFGTVIGHQDDQALADQLATLRSEDRVVYLRIPRHELGRRRFKVAGSDGLEYGIALSRDTALGDGCVLQLDAGRAVVVVAEEESRLALRATTIEGGIQLGFHAGHLHWRVRMADDGMTVLLEAPVEDYLARIRTYLDDGSIEVLRA
jgi:urease accessory protein